MAKLTAAFVRTATLPGKYGDQHGLILRVTPGGSKQWIWRGTVRGRRRDLGLGAYPYTTLAEARATAFEYRKLARSGGNPTELRKALNVPTFREAAEATIRLHAPGWRDPRREHNWHSSLQRFVYPRLGERPVSEIGAEDVLAVVAPIWADKRETARKVKGRIAAVLAWATAQGHRREGDDPIPAVTRALPRNGHQVEHHRALPHTEIAAALAKVQASDAWPATKLAFEYLVLTAARSGEVRGARWDEIDIDAAVWTVPATRTKTGRAWRVPLSTAALAVLEEAETLADSSGLIFPSPTGRPLSDSTLSKLLRENNIDAVPHGCRSSFRTWAGESGVAREIAEASLAHVAEATERAYARGDLLERRRPVLESWGRYVAG